MNHGKVSLFLTVCENNHVLGPILFLVCVNELTDLHRERRCSLPTSSSYIPKRSHYQTLRIGLAKVHEWSYGWRILLNEKAGIFEAWFSSTHPILLLWSQFRTWAVAICQKSWRFGGKLVIYAHYITAVKRPRAALNHSIIALLWA